ncbi:inorganic diphosphatase [Oceanococcus atlanticus]|uniref:Inorganic pyrophosphatase n=1 Tax=Oceanococcus atlanticus TaxID=1317117 RepID=A0A1Y1SHM6_9GAMM|nr:inorganic diphosphatase [Oceanococcus atlanticus]ORE89172.1 inorganic diphosphatase [Oceanococcus atlanticus]RZO85148.1 MAG: inorganic diphosphatase [Oceanococcus sp.]
MGYEAIGPGDKAPDEIHVVIEIAAHGHPVKYEVDKDSNTLYVDRFMNVSMHYPANYGFVNKTLYDDGDPVDVLVLTPYPIVPGCVIKCRPVAVLMTEDESGLDAKVLAVPTDKVSTGYYKDMQDLADVPERLQNEITHFFERYKDNEEGKWVKVTGWFGVDKAKEEIQKSIDAYKG